MGATYVDVTIRNPAAPAKSWTGRFLVDTGAFNSLAPRRLRRHGTTAPRAVDMLAARASVQRSGIDGWE